jgi:hypothetical protein
MVGDPVLKNEPSSIRPGDITYVEASEGRRSFTPAFEVRPEALMPLVNDIKEVQARIQRAFLVDVFMAITNMEGVQPRNDLEIAERKQEKLQRLGPVIGLWKSEVAPALLQRALAIVQRRGLLAPRPMNMRNLSLKFAFTDMVTLAQLGAETAGMERTMQVLGNLSAAARGAQLPDPLRILNMEMWARIYADRMHAPEKGLYTPQQVEQNDKLRAKQMQQAQMPALAQSAVDGAKTLSQTELGGGQNALMAMLGQGGNPAGGGGLPPAPQ